jgi:hypothetical protein
MKIYGRDVHKDSVFSENNLPWRKSAGLNMKTPNEAKRLGAKANYLYHYNPQG